MALKRAMALHGSTIEFLVPTGSSATIELSPAYLHESTGEPGVDAGRCYFQDIHLQLSECEILSPALDLPAVITDASVTLGDRRFQHLLPLPVIHVGRVELRFETDKGEALQVQANGVLAILAGERVSTADFSGRNSP